MNKEIIGLYGYETDGIMHEPALPTNAVTMDGRQYDSWVASQNPVYKRPLEELKEKITHVSYPVFLENLQVALNNFKTNQPDRFVAFVQPDKSQKWVAELALEQGVIADSYLCCGEEGANQLDFALESIKENSDDVADMMKDILIVDDGSYSGNQMANNISAANAILKRHFPGIHPTFHVAIPYITNVALERINCLKKKNIRIKLHTAEIMPSIAETIEPRNLNAVKEILWPRQPEEVRDRLAAATPLYWFDHKIPNSMSFPETLALGIVTKPKKGCRVERVPFLPVVQPPYKAV